jgi:hypothetical protein
MERVVKDGAGILDRWRARLPKTRTMDEIIDDYLRIYHER